MLSLIKFLFFALLGLVLLVPVAILVTVIGAPLLLVGVVLAIPVMIVVAIIGLPVLLAIIAGGVILGCIGAIFGIFAGLLALVLKLTLFVLLPAAFVGWAVSRVLGVGRNARVGA